MKRPTANDLLLHPFMLTTKPDSIFEILKTGKGKKSNNKKKNKKDKLDVEDEVTFRIWSSDGTQYKSVLVPAHVTVEDLCKRSSELFPLTKPITEYGLYIQLEENGKYKEKKLDLYELPLKVIETVLESKKKRDEKEKKRK